MIAMMRSCRFWFLTVILLFHDVGYINLDGNDLQGVVPSEIAQLTLLGEKQ